MPVILQGVMWMFTLWIGKSTAEVLNLNGPAKLLENISSVFSTLIAVLLCIMSIYILSTAAVIMLVPVKNAVSSFNTDIEEKQNSVKEISTNDEAYSNAVIKQTEINLETALKNLLLQNNITIKSCDIILSRVENNGIIIASISIYIDKEFVRYTNLVSSIVYDNFGITPNIMTE